MSQEKRMKLDGGEEIMAMRGSAKVGRCGDIIEGDCCGMLSGRNVGLFGGEMPEPELLVVCRSCKVRAYDSEGRLLRPSKRVHWSKRRRRRR